MKTPGTSAVALPNHVLATELVRIEAALERGDVGTARRVVADTRRALGSEAPTARDRLRVVGGVGLTDRERAILHRLTDGSMSQKDIARDLDVSRNTVKTHLKSIYQKLGAHCRGEAIHRARELGLLTEPLAPMIAMYRPPEQTAV